MTQDIKSEIDYIQSENFKLGQYIYMAMAKVGEHRVCIAVGYKIDYCIKKALQFSEKDHQLTFTHINKVKVGELERTKKFEWVENKELQVS
ncbi:MULTISPECIES: hypothetical protein [Amniculibacterium]|uniref:hypothetical protein n=1 Tax=Amniculibacterium TaxID=2715289 RepID=UPI000F5A86E9|nr:MULTISPECIES: hypothetical protein [Amniculibacterium]